MCKAILLLLVCGTALSQAPAFEVASVKPAAPVTGHQQYHMTVSGDQGRMDFVNASLLDLIHTAYRVNAYQVQGPPWMPTEKFDVLTKLPPGAAREQVPNMLQALLAERFKLAVHHSRQVLPAYALVIRQGGTKPAPSPAGPQRGSWSRTFSADGAMHMETRNMTMPALADLVSSFLGRPVIDQTQLAGEYDVPLDFSPEDLSTGSRSAGVLDPGDVVPAGSTVANSLQHAGLKLEARKLPLDVIVVDRLEKLPTAN